LGPLDCAAAVLQKATVIRRARVSRRVIVCILSVEIGANAGEELKIRHRAWNRGDMTPRITAVLFAP
jgi:hypothetical protein